MSNQYLTPDPTMKNIWTVMRSNKSDKMVLSCKKFPKGLSPKAKSYGFVLTTLCYCLWFFLFILLREQINSLAGQLMSAGWSEKTRFLISGLLALPVGIPIFAIVIPLSFRFTRWVPAEPEENDACK